MCRIHIQLGTWCDVHITGRSIALLMLQCKTSTSTASFSSQLQNAVFSPALEPVLTAAVKSLHPKICIAVYCSISLHPQLPCMIPIGIMSQLITGDYVIKFERNSFRVQLSARGIAICFASAQPKAQVSRGVDCLCLCLPSKSKSKSQIATLAFFWHLQVIALKTGACWLHKLCFK